MNQEPTIKLGLNDRDLTQLKNPSEENKETTEEATITQNVATLLNIKKLSTFYLATMLDIDIEPEQSDGHQNNETSKKANRTRQQEQIKIALHRYMTNQQPDNNTFSTLQELKGRNTDQIRKKIQERLEQLEEAEKTPTEPYYDKQNALAQSIKLTKILIFLRKIALTSKHQTNSKNIQEVINLYQTALTKTIYKDAQFITQIILEVTKNPNKITSFTNAAKDKNQGLSIHNNNEQLKLLLLFIENLNIYMGLDTYENNLFVSENIILEQLKEIAQKLRTNNSDQKLENNQSTKVIKTIELVNPTTEKLLKQLLKKLKLKPDYLRKEFTDKTSIAKQQDKILPAPQYDKTSELEQKYELAKHDIETIKQFLKFMIDTNVGNAHTYILQKILKEYNNLATLLEQQENELKEKEAEQKAKEEEERIKKEAEVKAKEEEILKKEAEERTKQLMQEKANKEKEGRNRKKDTKDSKQNRSPNIKISTTNKIINNLNATNKMIQIIMQMLY